MAGFGFVVFVLMTLVTGMEEHKRILMSDESYVQGLEVKIQELTAQVNQLSARDQSFQTLFQELIDNVTRFTQSPTAVLHSCPDGYTKMHNSCYKIHYNSLSWPESMTFCKSFGAHLVEIDTVQEHNYIKDRVTELQSAGNHYWIGASDADVEGQWIWALNNQPANLVWTPGEPNQGTGANCASLWKHSQYNVSDDDCSLRMNYICEIELGSGH